MESFDVGFLMGFLCGSIVIIAVAILIEELRIRSRARRPIELDQSLEALRRIR